MRIAYNQLKKCSVETESGESLGHISDIEIEVDGQSILNYVVRPHVLSTDRYYINREQIVRFEEEKVIVDDNVEKIAIEKKRVQRPQSNPEPVVMRK